MTFVGRDVEPNGPVLLVDYLKKGFEHHQIHQGASQTETSQPIGL